MLEPQIYINGRFLARSISGVERYSIEICKCLLKLNPSIIIIAPLKAKKQKSIDSVNIVYTGKHSGHYWEQVTLPLFLRKKNNPILLNFANLAPVFYANKIVTLHDIAYKDHPEWFSALFVKYYNVVVPIMLKYSLQVLTVSEFSKASICKAYNIPASKVTITYNGLSESFVEKKELTKPFDFKYVLSVGTFQPRKNLQKLIEAYNTIKKPKFKLVIVGAKNKLFKNADTNLSELNDNIILLNNVSDTELGALYNYAHKFVYPSLYEGFGLPIIEALHYNCTVYASNISVFKELFGLVISYFNPNNVEDIRKALEIIEPKKDYLLVKKQIKKYNFASSAEIILSAIEKFKSSIRS